MHTHASLLSFALACGVAGAGISHDESVDGDLSSDPNAPTALVFMLGANTVSGTVRQSNSPTGDRDYLTFTVGAGQRLSALNLLAYSPDNPGFAAFNTGATSFIPDATTDASFLSGILPEASQVGTDLMPAFVSDAVTTNSLSNAWLGAGTYTFMIQQTTNVEQAYALEFVITPTPGGAALLGIAGMGAIRRRRA
ncbi:MAG: hypothetical protein DHS20C14_04060 [Phycisphaeraceae bacterium]|nr:MAG: hypothetical protein DHS20C14_04060 [Phycisphaeraceae bacterium]